MGNGPSRDPECIRAYVEARPTPRQIRQRPRRRPEDRLRAAERLRLVPDTGWSGAVQGQSRRMSALGDKRAIDCLEHLCYTGRRRMMREVGRHTGWIRWMRRVTWLSALPQLMEPATCPTGNFRLITARTLGRALSITRRTDHARNGSSQPHFRFFGFHAGPAGERRCGEPLALKCQEGAAKQSVLRHSGLGAFSWFGIWLSSLMLWEAWRSPFLKERYRGICPLRLSYFELRASDFVHGRLCSSLTVSRAR